MSLSDPLKLTTLTVAALAGPAADRVAEKLYYTDDALYHPGARAEFGNQLSLTVRINHLLVDNLLDGDSAGRSCELTVIGGP